MNTIFKRNTIPSIAALLFLLFGIANVLDLTNHLGSFNFSIIYYSIMIVLCIILSYSSFFQKQNIMLIISFVLIALEISFIVRFSIRFDIASHIICFILFSLIIILCLKNNQIIKAIWFIPGSMIILCCIINCFRYGGIYYIFCFRELSLGSALIVTGLWLSKSTTEIYKINKSNNAQESTTYRIDTADKLKSLKEMLDEGLITEEEFAAKKKQLLGL